MSIRFHASCPRRDITHTRSEHAALNARDSNHCSSSTPFKRKQKQIDAKKGFLTPHYSRWCARSEMSPLAQLPCPRLRSTALALLLAASWRVRRPNRNPLTGTRARPCFALVEGLRRDDAVDFCTGVSTRVHTSRTFGLRRLAARSAPNNGINSPVSSFWNASSTLLASNADVSIKLSPF